MGFKFVRPGRVAQRSVLRGRKGGDRKSQVEKLRRKGKWINMKPA